VSTGLHSMPVEPIGEFFGYSGNPVTFNAISDQIFRHYDRHADVCVVGLMKLAAEWARLNPITGTTEIGKKFVVPHRRETSGNPDVFATGEAETDEPFAVKQPGRFLQQRNPPPVVLDQVVVGLEYACNAPLIPQLRANNGQTLKITAPYALYVGP
jgi:hypothetical protein